MQVYETTFIVNPQINETDIARHVKDVADLIAKSGGKIVHEDHLGTRRMAYDIKGLSQGYYGNFIYEAPADFPKSLERHFKLEEAYLRYLTIRFEGDVDRIVEDKASAEKVVAPYKRERRPDSGRRPERRDGAPVSEAAKPESVEAQTEPKKADPAPVVEPEVTTEPATIKTAPEELPDSSDTGQQADPISDEKPEKSSSADASDDEL